MSLEQRMDDLHAAARANTAFQRLAIITRILLALAFIPTGLVKLLGERFTAMGVDNPVGFFFEAMYQSGAYWNFIGTAQVLAGILLLIPRTATVGAILFFPIVLNIFVITVSLHFQGTPFITGPMLLGAIFLLCWDYDRLKAVLWPPRTRVRSRRVPVVGLELAGYVVGTLAGLGLFGWTRGFLPRSMLPVCLGVGVLAVLMVSTAWIRLALRSPARP